MEPKWGLGWALSYLFLQGMYFSFPTNLLTKTTSGLHKLRGIRDVVTLQDYGNVRYFRQLGISETDDDRMNRNWKHITCTWKRSKRKHIEHLESINDTYVVETVDSNAIPDSSYMCDDEGTAKKYAEESEDERVLLASLVEYVQTLEKEVDELEYEKAEFSNKYDLLLQECLSNNIIELKKLIEKTKGKSVETNFEKPLVVRQTNMIKVPKPSVLGKPAPFLDSLKKIDISKPRSGTQTNVIKDLSKPVTPDILHQKGKQAERNMKVIKSWLPPLLPLQTSQNTQIEHLRHSLLRSTQIKDKVVQNNSQVKIKKKEAEDHHRIFRSNLSNVPSSSNSLADCTNHPIHCMMRFGNDQFAPIIRYGDLVQGNITIKRVYYVEGLNHNLFSVGQFCDADLEVVIVNLLALLEIFRKTTSLMGISLDLIST
ncbi:hypothetical protein Tco_1074571 [Tanacetum coccineum]